MISALRKQGCSQVQIAQQLGRHPSTISREIRRNSSTWDGRYRPSKAIEKTNGRRSRSRRNRQFNPKEFGLVEALIRQDLSPEQASGYLRRKALLSISHETIYRYVWDDLRSGGTLYKHLRGSRKKRRKRYGRYDSRGRLAGKRHISTRPPGADNRSRIGHWEIDTVMGTGSQDCLLTMVERKTGLVLIGKLQARTTEEANKRAVQLVRRLRGRFRTITADNGTEFHGYKSIERQTGVKFYFATPHHSWERGTSENTNGLIRQYVPKGTSMTNLTQRQCNAIAEKLNNRPRKRHGYRTPRECFYGL